MAWREGPSALCLASNANEAHPVAGQTEQQGGHSPTEGAFFPKPVRWFGKVTTSSANADGLSSIPGTRMVDGENRLPKALLFSRMV